jgi:hypothetical protein
MLLDILAVRYRLLTTENVVASDGVRNESRGRSTSSTRDTTL